jgi:hypothetical protein
MNENTGKHAAVNGLEMYYEIHGEGTRNESAAARTGPPTTWRSWLLMGFSRAQRGS